jgi:hypothetical protein
VHVGAAASTKAAVASSLVPFHVTSDAEGLATAAVRAAERLLTSMAMGVDLQTGRTAESLVASRAEIAILLLWQRTCR